MTEFEEFKEYTVEIRFKYFDGVSEKDYNRNPERYESGACYPKPYINKKFVAYTDLERQTKTIEVLDSIIKNFSYDVINIEEYKNLHKYRYGFKFPNDSIIHAQLELIKAFQQLNDILNCNKFLFDYKLTEK